MGGRVRLSRRTRLGGSGEQDSRAGPASQPSGMKGRISSGFNSDSSRGRSTWKSWTWGGPGWALGAGPPGRWGIGSSEGWAGRGAVKKYWCRRAWGQQQGTEKEISHLTIPASVHFPGRGASARSPPKARSHSI